jgi:hypothetical protein
LLDERKDSHGLPPVEACRCADNSHLAPAEAATPGSSEDGPAAALHPCGFAPHAGYRPSLATFSAAGPF